MENTKLSKRKIKIWFQKFLQDCPSAQLTKEKMVDQVAVVLPVEKGEIIADLVFKEFDTNNNGWIDFNEFLVAIHCLTMCEVAEQLRWAFKLADSDGSGGLEVKELVQLFGTFYLNEGLDPHHAVERALRVFSVLDVDNDCNITEEEFVKGCLNDEQMAETFG